MNAARDWRPPLERDGFVRAAVDPYVNALHCALQRGERHLRPSIQRERRGWLERALGGGPAALSGQERRVLIADPQAAAELHRRIWELEDEDQAELWGRPAAAG
jgi:membrane glycosyltransferase